jgi:hypothetical protein
MGYYGSWQHQRDMDKRAVIQMARAKVDEIEVLLRNARLQQRASTRIIYKTKEDALVARRLRYHVTDNVRYR